MSIFYVNAEKDVEGNEYFDKFDFSKFVDGKSDTPEDTKLRIRKVVSGES